MAQTPLDPHVEAIDIEEEVKRSYLDYAMSVIVGRALPDARDGLKPVHRRILHSMNENNIRPDRPFVKSARVVGDVLGRYHPHGDTAAYDALVRMAQDFAMRAPIIQGHGNFGTVDGDPAAAMRYCVTGDALVRTPCGTARIAELASNVAENSDCDLDRKVSGRRGEPVRATKLFHSGTHPTLRVETREGYALSGTRNHPVLCLVAIEGVPMLLWKLLEEIRPGDHVALLRTEPDESDVITEREWQAAFLAGAFVSEGWVSEERAGCSAEKRIPSFVWHGGPALKAAFLQALYEGDGSSSLLPRATIQIRYSTRSETLARDVQLMLLEFGIVSRRYLSPQGEHRVVVTNRRDGRLFASRVGFFGRKQERLNRQLESIPLGGEYALSSDYVPFLAEYVRSERMERWEDRDWLQRHNIDRIERWERRGEEILRHITDPEVRRVVEPLVDGTYYFATVDSVEDSGPQPVYSLRVDSRDHAFVTNGFVSHNTECRLAPLAMELLRDIGEETVDFVPNYDGTEQEPIVLPARLPNLLVNGSTGIAVGMATNIPPHNLGEVIDAVVAAIDDPEITPAQLMKHIKGPDFPGGGIIMGREGIKSAYTTGRGSIKVRARATIEESKSGKAQIVVTELPYMVSGDRVLAKVAELVEKKVITGITPSAKAVRNESNRHGLRLVIELKRDAIPQVVLNNLYKHTQLQDSFGVIMLALVDGIPRVLNVAEVIQVYIGHQIEVVTRRTKYRLRRAEERAHVLEGLLVAIKNLDAVIKLIRQSKTAEDARAALMKQYELSEIQANAILDMQLRRLAALERQKIEEEHAELQKQIKELKSILGDPAKVRAIVKDELIEIRKKFADPRRSEIAADQGEIDVEDLIADDDVVLTLTRSGYVKRVPVSVYRAQARGGKGVRGAAPKEGDIVHHLLSTTNHAYVLFFSNRGKVYRVKAHEVPEKDRTARGISIRNLLPLQQDESIAAIIDTRDYATHKYLVIATKHGVVKKTPFEAYDSSRRDGIIAVKLRPGDEVVQVLATSGEDELMLISRKGQGIRFPETEVRPMGRDASGVIGMRLRADDEVVACDVVDPNAELLVVTDAGFGKRTPLKHFTAHHRGGMGIRAVKLTSKRGFVAGAQVVFEGYEVFLISSDGVVIRTRCKEISRQGRDASGVRVMRLNAGATVSAIARAVGDQLEVEE